MYQLPDHPDIEHALRTGYPSWVKDTDVDEEEDDFEDDEDIYEDGYEDSAYEEARERELFGKE